MTGPGILTIEDDAAIRRGIVDSLKASGYVVWQSGRADEGAQMALQKPCDLVLLDLVLPGGSGLDVLRMATRLAISSLHRDHSPPTCRRLARSESRSIHPETIP